MCMCSLSTDCRWNRVRRSSAGVYHNCDDLNRSEVVSLRLMTVLELKIVFWSWFAEKSDPDVFMVVT